MKQRYTLILYREYKYGLDAVTYRNCSRFDILFILFFRLRRNGGFLRCIIRKNNKQDNEADTAIKN